MEDTAVLSVGEGISLSRLRNSLIGKYRGSFMSSVSETRLYCMTSNTTIFSASGGGGCRVEAKAKTEAVVEWIGGLMTAIVHSHASGLCPWTDFPHLDSESYAR